MHGNRYFEVIEAFRWFKDLGHSETNTYVGRSMALDTVREQTLARPGDQVHALVGGTFLVRADGSVESGALRLPKPLFEKSYGGIETDASVLAKMAACGRCREIPEPAARIEYGAAREKARANKMPRLSGPVLKEGAEMTPLLEMLCVAAQDADLRLVAEEAGGKVYRVDVGMGGEPDSLDCSVVVDLPGKGRVSVIATPARREIWVLDRVGGFADHVRNAWEGLNAEYRNESVTIFPESQAGQVMLALADRIEAVAAPAPGA